MDETGYLQEDEIYCSVHTEKGGQIIQGSVVITRSPALHPGDVRCVMAVDVPPDSPLQALHNVVVFSRHGERDLPSKLSGGDLDGDIYNIIYDDALYPKRLAQPADYPTAKPVDIGRPVERPDITDFFIRFMENDNLGLIATLHQILADRNPQGTFDPICVAVAEMHSTAVDFSKTGIPVSFSIRLTLFLFGNANVPRLNLRVCQNIPKSARISKRPAPAFLLRRPSKWKKMI